MTINEVYAVFGGQGQNKHYFKELSLLIETYSVELQDLLNSVQLRVPVMEWITNSGLDAIALEKPRMSVPLIGLTQLAQFVVCCKSNSMTPNQFISKMNGILGHSQGIVTAVCVACSNCWDTFYAQATNAMILLESIGRESELFWDVFYDDSVNGSCMLSVQGVNQEWLAAMLEDFDNVTLSLVNGPSNFVVSGSTDALQLFKDFAQIANGDCKAKFLPIHGPFHSLVYKDCADALKLEWKDLTWGTLQVPVWSTFDGSDIRDCENITESLIDLLLVKPVDWIRVIKNVTTPCRFVDFGPGGSHGMGAFSASVLQPAPVQCIHEPKLFLEQIKVDLSTMILDGFQFVDDVHMVRKGSELIAFVINPTIDLSKLYEIAFGRLPRYMHPSIIVPLTEFPTKHGVVDDEKLLELDLSQYQAPQSSHDNLNAQELLLAQLIASLLEIEVTVLTPTSDFFMIGGDSISAILLAQKSHEIGMKLTTRDVFQRRTIQFMVKYGVGEDVGVPLAEIVIPAVARQEFVTEWAKKLGLDHDVDMYPCTPLQSAMLASTIIDCSSYLQQVIWKVTKPMTAERMFTAWKKVVEKHDILRTCFVTIDGNGYQLLRSSADDVVLHPKQDSLTTALDGIMKQGFSPNDKYWFKCTTVTDTNQEYFVLTIHHLLYDGWSLELILSDFDAAYHQRLQDNRVAFKPYLQYLQGRDINTVEAFWKSYLEDVSQPSLFVKQLEEVGIGKLDCTLDIASLRLHQAALKFNTTEACLMKVAWGLTLRLYSQTDDVVFAEVVSGRDIDLPGIESMSGPTISTIPCRINFEITDITSIFQKLEKEQVDRFDYCGIGLSTIQNWVQINPLVETMFTFQNNRERKFLEPAMVPMNDDGLVVWNQVTFPVEVQIFPHSEKLKMRVSYQRFRVSDSMVNQLSETFHSIAGKLVDSAFTGVQQTYQELLALPAKQLNQVIQFGKGKIIDVPYRLVLDAVQEQVTKNPTKIALEQGCKSITFSELDLKSTQFAYFLISKGVKTGDFVPLVIKRSIDFIIGILGVVKAGAAYVPVDFSMPVNRIVTILEEAHCRDVVYHEDIPNELLTEMKKMNLGLYMLEEEKFYGQSPLEPSRPVDGDDPAYVVFTSGSTGKPKGVVIAHKSLANYATVQIPTSYQVSGMKWANIVSVNFDTCTSDIFLNLCAGNTLVLRQDSDLGLLKLVDCVHMTPSLIQHLQPEDYPNLKQIVLGGEALPLETAKKWGSKVKLYNTYGPSEITITSSWKPMSNSDGVVTIGKPLPNSFQYILDSKMEPVPIGVPGELVIGGVGVALGYLHRPDLTAEKFIDDRFLNNGFKMYRTGDSCRWLENGEIDFLGRMDDMVKVGGYRIELNEVRDALEHIESAEVMKLEEKLVAFVTPKDVLVDDILEAAFLKLPHFMIPTVIVPLDSFPLTGNGKVDRKQLANIDLKLYMSDNTGYEGMSLLEKEFAKIIAEIVRVDVITLSSKSDFFHIGGDSITAILLAKRSEDLGLNLTTKDIFTRRTVRLLVKHGQSKILKKEPLPKVHISNQVLDAIQNFKTRNQPEIIDVYPCVPCQASLLVRTMIEPESYILQLGWTVPSNFDLDDFKKGVKKAMEAHTVLRSRFYDGPDTMYQLVQKMFEPKIEVHTNVKEYLKLDLKRGFRIHDHQWFRLCLIKDGDAYSQIILSIHHALYDGYSINTIITDLFSPMNGKQVISSVPYKIVAETIESTRAESYKFWKEYLTDYRPVQAFPSSAYSSIKTTSTTTTESHVPTKELARAAKALSTTTSTLVKTAWCLTLCSFGESNDIAFGMMFSGRDSEIQGIHDIVGNTLNMCPSRNIFNLDGGLAEFIKDTEADTNKISLMYPRLSHLIGWSGSIPWTPKLFSSVLFYQNLPSKDKQDILSFDTATKYYSNDRFFTDFEMNMMVLPNEEKLQLDLVHTGFKSEFAYSVLETFNATLDLIYVSAISNQNPTLGDLLQEHPSELDTQGCCGLNIELNPLILKHGTNISTWSTFAKLTKWALFPADK